MPDMNQCIFDGYICTEPALTEKDRPEGLPLHFLEFMLENRTDRGSVYIPCMAIGNLALRLSVSLEKGDKVWIMCAFAPQMKDLDGKFSTVTKFLISSLCIQEKLLSPIVLYFGSDLSKYMA